RGVKNRYPKAGIGDMLVVSVKKGTPEMRKQIMRAVVIRQKKEYRRPDGMHVSFEDNAVVITDNEGLPKGTEIKGPVAREVAERFPKIASAATIIV
ncbi:MAG TPA: 50S ribosomal protein L14, partial [Methanosarcinales archaeon]|nr:50S ribosomal protein L14 [Methanosarcinales archaeon]